MKFAEFVSTEKITSVLHIRRLSYSSQETTIPQMPEGLCSGWCHEPRLLKGGKHPSDSRAAVFRLMGWIAHETREHALFVSWQIHFTAHRGQSGLQVIINTRDTPSLCVPYSERRNAEKCWRDVLVSMVTGGIWNLKLVFKKWNDCITTTHLVVY